ncbi:hypothetical protein T08_4385 [Trichinella sp. T8]|nr:hypothetical protein T08_4385 [Trichinella sp. T8]
MALNFILKTLDKSTFPSSYICVSERATNANNGHRLHICVAYSTYLSRLLTLHAHCLTFMQIGAV